MGFKEVIAASPRVSGRRFGWWRWAIVKKKAWRRVITSIRPENARTSVDQPANQLVRARGINIFPGLFSDGISSDDLGPLAHLIYASSAQPFPLPASIFSTEKFLKILLLFTSLASLSLSFFLSRSLFLPISLPIPRRCGSRLNCEEKGVPCAAFSTRKTPLYAPAVRLYNIITKSPINGRYLSVGLPDHRHKDRYKFINIS